MCRLRWARFVNILPHPSTVQACFLFGPAVSFVGTWRPLEGLDTPGMGFARGRLGIGIRVLVCGNASPSIRLYSPESVRTHLPPSISMTSSGSYSKGVSECARGFTRYRRGGGDLRRGGGRPRGSTPTSSPTASVAGSESAVGERLGTGPWNRKDTGVSASFMMAPPPWRKRQTHVRQRSKFSLSLSSQRRVEDVPMAARARTRSFWGRYGLAWRDVLHSLSQKAFLCGCAGARSVCVQVGGHRSVFSMSGPSVETHH